MSSSIKFCCHDDLPPSASYSLWPGVNSWKVPYSFHTWTFHTRSSQSHPQICRQHKSDGLRKEQTKGQFCIQRRKGEEKHHSQRKPEKQQEEGGSPGVTRAVFYCRTVSTSSFTVSERQARSTWLENCFFQCEIRLTACKLLHHKQT